MALLPAALYARIRPWTITLLLYAQLWLVPTLASGLVGEVTEVTAAPPGDYRLLPFLAIVSKSVTTAYGSLGRPAPAAQRAAPLALAAPLLLSTNLVLCARRRWAPGLEAVVVHADAGLRVVAALGAAGAGPLPGRACERTLNTLLLTLGFAVPQLCLLLMGERGEEGRGG